MVSRRKIVLCLVAVSGVCLFACGNKNERLGEFFPGQIGEWIKQTKTTNAGQASENGIGEEREINAEKEPVSGVGNESETGASDESMSEERSGEGREIDGEKEPVSGVGNESEPGVSDESMPEETVEAMDKGYDFPVDEVERKEAEADCLTVMSLILDQYQHAHSRKKASHTIFSDGTILKMKNTIKKSGYPVYTMVAYSNMGNYRKMDRFLRACEDQKSGSVIVYEVRSDGGVERTKFIYDGEEMYALSAAAVWEEEDKPIVTAVSYTRIKEWKYTPKGWFFYELCVPEYPEVTEMMDGSCRLRVKPLSKQKRKLSRKCVQGLGYQGNNLLYVNWDTNHLAKLDYNGLYEYLYEMKYQKKFRLAEDADGIPRAEFEHLLMEYLPITEEQIRKFAVFDQKTQTYAWVRLGCFNYAPAFFDLSLPEVTAIKENKDGTVTLTVDAVGNMVICEDAIITHKLTVRFAKDGSFQYLGNQILNNGIQDIPEYQYRISRK